MRHPCKLEPCRVSSVVSLKILHALGIALGCSSEVGIGNIFIERDRLDLLLLVRFGVSNAIFYG